MGFFTSPTLAYTSGRRDLLSLILSEKTWSRAISGKGKQAHITARPGFKRTTLGLGPSVRLDAMVLPVLVLVLALGLYSLFRLSLNSGLRLSQTVRPLIVSDNAVLVDIVIVASCFVCISASVQYQGPRSWHWDNLLQLAKEPRQLSGDHWVS